MLVWMLLISLIAGWLVNLVADTAPERRSIRETWLWSLCQLPAPLPQKLGLGEMAANDRTHRPWRYLFVWCATLLLGWFAYQRLGFTLGGLVLAIQAWFFLAVAVIDLEHRRVLNSMLLAALPVIGIFDLINGLPSPTSAVGGALTGFGLFLLLALIRPGGIGMGDVKLAGVIGLATGFHGVIGAIMICMFTGGLAAAFVLLKQPKQRGQTMAYAPYLVIGAWAALYYGVSVWHF
ncbi:MAG: A24 family peptidase [Caldilineaceae bacterium]